MTTGGAAAALQSETRWLLQARPRRTVSHHGSSVTFPRTTEQRLRKRTEEDGFAMRLCENSQATLNLLNTKTGSAVALLPATLNLMGACEPLVAEKHLSCLPAIPSQLDGYSTTWPNAENASGVEASPHCPDDRWEVQASTCDDPRKSDCCFPIPATMLLYSYGPGHRLGKTVIVQRLSWERLSKNSIATSAATWRALVRGE